MTSTTEDELTDYLMTEEFSLDERTLLRMREDVVPKYMRGMVPKCTRIDVPFLNKFLQRETGDILCGLGTNLKHLTTRNDLDEQHMLWRGVVLVREAQQRILYLRGGKTVFVKMLDGRDHTKSSKSE